MKRFLIILMALMTFSADAYADSRLTGAWGVDGQVLYRFNADGTGDVGGEPFRWKAANGVLTLTAGGESEQIAFQLQGNTLLVNAGGLPIALERIGNAPGNRSGATTQEAGGAKRRDEAGNDQLSTLLLSSAWCSFSYNKISGSTKSRRIQLFRDGTWSDSSRAEGYSSGYGGTMASQHDSGGGGRWAVNNGQLYISEAGGDLQPVQLQVKTNSSGYPIIVADGVEYSQCQ